MSRKDPTPSHNAKLAAFLRAEFALIRHPTSPAATHQFRHVDQLVDLFFAFLELQIDEPDLARLESKVTSALSVLIEGKHAEAIAQALEDLAAAFESFLKKLAAVKYANDTLRLRGDGSRYAGLLRTTLGLLLDGRVAKVNPRDNSVPPLHAPIVSFQQGGASVRDAVYDKTRSLRNDVHVSRDRPFIEALGDCKTVLAAYFLALEENIGLVQAAANPLFQYLRRVRDAFQAWQTKYVALLGQARQETQTTSWQELQALPWRDESEECADHAISAHALTHGFSAPEFKVSPSSASVFDIAKAHRRFWLLGEPGAGKSTTLQRLALHRANELLDEGYLVQPVPVFIKLRDVSPDVQFEVLLTALLNVESRTVLTMLNSGQLWLLLDGFNEVPAESVRSVTRLVSKLLHDYGLCPVTITSRRFGFQRQIGLPVFELLPLSDEAILDYFIKHLGSTEDAIRTYDLLRSAPHLLFELARNPMMLSMLVRVAPSKEPLNNRGQLFKLFMKWIVERERKTEQMPSALKEAILSKTAMQIRRQGGRQADHHVVLSWIRDTLTEWRAEIGVNDAFAELQDNHILETDYAGRTTFWHELILEYFAAVELRRQFLCGAEDVGPYFQRSEWSETLRMMSGLLSDATTMIMENAQRNIVLAAQCISSGATVDDAAAARVVAIAADRLEKDLPQAVECVTALLELGSKEALTLVVKHLSRAADSFPLTTAVARCERPEQAIIRLIGHGLTGKHRIFQCLSALENMYVSRSVIDSPEVAAGQRRLLEADPSARVLRLLGEIGVSGAVSRELVTKLKEVVRDAPLEDPLWRQAIATTVRLGLQSEVSPVVGHRLSTTSAVSPSDHFAVFTALVALKDLSNVKLLAVEHVARSLSRGWFGLAVRYLQAMDLAKVVPASTIEQYTSQLGVGGRIQSILEFKAMYPSINWDPILAEAVGARLRDGNLDVLRHYRGELAPFLEPLKDEVARVVLARARSGLTPRAAGALCRAFEVAAQLHGYGLIKKAPTRERPYGFVYMLDGSGDAHFRASVLDPVYRFTLAQGTLVRAVTVPSSKRDGLSACSVTPVDRDSVRR